MPCRERVLVEHVAAHDRRRAALRDRGRRGVGARERDHLVAAFGQAR